MRLFLAELKLHFGFVCSPFDVMLMTATLQKIPKGAWFPCALGVCLAIFMLFWHFTFGKNTIHAATRSFGCG